MSRFQSLSAALGCVVLLALSYGGVQPARVNAQSGGATPAATPSPTVSDDPAQVAFADIAPDAPVDALAGISVGTGGVPASQQCAFTVGVDDPGVGGQLFELEPDFLSFQANQPTICSDQDLKTAQAYALSPTGNQVSLSSFSFTSDGQQKQFAVTLPLSAYMQPGVWRLGIKQPVAVELQVKIPVPTQPFFMRGRGETSLIGGFKPGEQVKAIAFKFQGTADEGRWAFTGVVTFQIARNGYRLLQVPNSHDVSFALIGQQHTFVLANARFDNNGNTGLPSNEQQAALYGAYWGTNAGSGNAGGNGTNPTPPPSSGVVKTRIDSKGIAQVWVEPGCFLMGSPNPRDLSPQIKDQTQRAVCLTAGYWIDQYEVSNASFQQFIAAGGYQTQAYWSESGWQWLQDNNRQGPMDYPGFSDPMQPRVGVSRFEAEAYAHWRGGNLPAEAEWEYAARGPQSSIYPWGNTFQNGLANIKGVAGHPVNVQEYPAGRSWVGAFNMAGNVGEWVSDCYSQSYDDQRVKDNPVGPCDGSSEMVKGSSWAFNQFPAQANYRFVNPSLKFWYDVGVRIVSK